ncbi:MAG TPA: hypothetical protein P5556_00375 [Candidatus Gastranaerophilales bacterium]|nr:hypothetical protein [Candidatus Gastranaerophilales bacterium]
MPGIQVFQSLRKVISKRIDISAISNPFLIKQRIESNAGKTLNIKSINPESDYYKLTIEDFNHSSDKKFVYLYRGLANVDKTEIKNKAHLSLLSSIGKGLKFLKNSLGLETKDKLSLMRHFSGLTQGYDPILHTSRSRRTALNFADKNGTIITYKIPVSFIEKKAVSGHVAEQEIDFFFGIPKKYIYKIKNIGKKEATDILYFNHTNGKNSKSSDIIELNKINIRN